MDVASCEGLEGLTIGRLASETGLSKAGLFAHFGSKEDLQLATLEAAAEVITQRVMSAVGDARPGLERLLALLRAWLAYVESCTFRGGCFLAAAAAEFDGRPGPVRDRVVELARKWTGLLEGEIAQAQARGEIATTESADQIAFELHAMVLEGNSVFQLLGDDRAFPRARRGAMRCLECVATEKGRKILRKERAHE